MERLGAVTRTFFGGADREIVMKQTHVEGSASTEQKQEEVLPSTQTATGQYVWPSDGCPASMGQNHSLAKVDCMTTSA
jgi:hypothetical protein